MTRPEPGQTNDRFGLIRWLEAQLDSDERLPYFDPDRVRDELETKRMILRRHYSQRDPRWDSDGHIGWRCAQCDTEYPCPTLLMIALPYRRHSGYRPEWRPS